MRPYKILRTEINNTHRTAVFLWQYRTEGSPSFYEKLVDLIAKADASNKNRLRLAFPEYVDAYNEWYHSEDPNEYFKKHGFTKE